MKNNKKQTIVNIMRKFINKVKRVFNKIFSPISYYIHNNIYLFMPSKVMNLPVSYEDHTDRLYEIYLKPEQEYATRGMKCMICIAEVLGIPITDDWRLKISTQPMSAYAANNYIEGFYNYCEHNLEEDICYNSLFDCLRFEISEILNDAA